MKKFNLTFAGLLAIGMLVLQLPQPANAQESRSGCSMSSLTGNFAFTISGWNNVGGTNVPVALVGKLIYSGTGSVSGTITSVQNGVVNLPSGLSGSYTVNADCTGASLITPEGSTTTAHFSIVVSGQDSVVYFIQTDNGNTMTGTANRQGPGPS